MSDDRKEQLFFEELRILPPSHAGDPFNFVNEVLIFLQRWCNGYNYAPDLNKPAYCCFIGFERVVTVAAEMPDVIECKYFKEDTPQDLLGRTYISSLPLNRVFARPEKLQSLADCRKTIESLGACSQPYVIFNATDRRVLWQSVKSNELRHGVLRKCEPSKLSSKDFDQTLQDFHFEYTATPQGLSKPWLSAPKLLTKQDLEEEIRDDLFVFLRFLIGDQFAVIREFHGSAGRTDLLVNFHSEGVILYIELKVLRSFTKSGSDRKKVKDDEVVEWGKKGIAQAHFYRLSNRRVGVSYACCFDGREKDVEINELVDFANTHQVRYRRYFMHSSAPSLHASIMS